MKPSMDTQVAKSDAQLWVVVMVAVVLFKTFDCIGMLDWLFASNEHASFYRDLVVLIVGLPVALAVNRFAEHRQDQLQSKEREQQLSRLRELLRNSLESNAHYAKQVVDTFENGIVPSFLMDTSSLQATTDIRLTLIDNLDILADLSKVEFELRHLNLRLELLMGLSLQCIDINARKATSFEIDSIKNRWGSKELVKNQMAHLPALGQATLFDIVRIQMTLGTTELADSTATLCRKLVEKLS